MTSRLIPSESGDYLCLCPRIYKIRSKRSNLVSTRCGAYFDVDQMQKTVKGLESQMAAPDFWSNRDVAVKVSQEAAELQKEIDTFEGMKKELVDLGEYLTLAESEGGDTKDVSDTLAGLSEKLDELEFRKLFSEEHDVSNAIVAIHAGSGGTEANDWAEMLTRMVFRYAERKKFTVDVLSESRGEVTGFKSIMFRVVGRFAYGSLKSESGVHRLVRISPFDAEKMRHTTFALIEVLPELEDVKEIEIDPKDLRIDTYLSSGHGGQSVQTTYSAVRIVHLPTGITVACQNERSQLQNKETAMKVLKSKLHQLALKARSAEKQDLRGEFASPEWGNQIRSYVLHPYKLVKDHRTDHETTDAEDVLDGHLEEFVEAYLRWRLGEGRMA